MLGQGQNSKKLHKRQRVVYTAPSNREYPAKIIQVDRRDSTVRIELEYMPGKWMPAWVSFSDVEGVC